MQVLDVLDERIIDLHAHANNKEEVLMLLSNKLKKAGYIDDVEEFKKDIYYRESLGQTFDFLVCGIKQYGLCKKSYVAFSRYCEKTW